jgi:myo-inositol-hexaphosphate 3-phosphohydrolase
MKRYNIKTTAGNSEYIDILKELDNEYLVRFTRDNNGNIKTTEETITRHLFNICVQTGYLNPMSEYSVA